MRPENNEGAKTETIKFRLTKSQKKQLKKLAKSNKMTVSEYILFKCLVFDKNKRIVKSQIAMYTGILLARKGGKN